MKIDSVFEAIKRQMEAELEAVRYAITHAGVKGTINEDVVKKFLRNYLAENLAIESGFLIDSSGGVSKQLDIIIFDKNKTPSFFMATGIRVIPIECAYAVIEVKTNLNGQALLECIENMKSVKSLVKQGFYRDSLIESGFTLYGQNFRDWPVMYFIFCFESNDLKTIATNLKTHLSSLPIEKRIDSIFSLEKGFLGNLTTDGHIDAIPASNSKFVRIEQNHLLLFYTLLSRYLNQAKMDNFNFNPYVKHLAFIPKMCE